MAGSLIANCSIVPMTWPNVQSAVAGADLAEFAGQPSTVRQETSRWQIIRIIMAFIRHKAEMALE